MIILCVLVLDTCSPVKMGKTKITKPKEWAAFGERFTLNYYNLRLNLGRKINEIYIFNDHNFHYDIFK